MTARSVPFCTSSLQFRSTNRHRSKIWSHSWNPSRARRSRLGVTDYSQAKNRPSKKYDNELDYKTRKLECRTLGRVLTGSYYGVSSDIDNGIKYYFHPVTDFHMFLRVDASDRTTKLCGRATTASGSGMFPKSCLLVRRSGFTTDSGRTRNF